MGRAADLVFADLRIEIAAAAARTRFETAIDELQGQRFPQAAFVVDNRVVDLPPGAEIAIGEGARERGFNDDRDFAHRVRRIGAAGRHGIAEVGGWCRGTAHFPVSKILFERRGEEDRIEVADDRNHGVFRTVPPVVERLHRCATRALEAVLGADGDTFGQSLTCEQGLQRLLADPFSNAATLALFRQHDRHFGPHVPIGQNRRTHHARQQLHALVELGRIHIGNIEFVDRVRRAGLGVGVAAKCRAKALPGGDGFRRAKVFALAEQQVLQQVRIPQLVVILVERSGIDAHADGYLPRRHAVLAHTIAQAIVEFAEQPFLIARDIAVLVDPRRFAFRLQRLRPFRFLRRQGLRNQQKEGEN